MVGSAANAAVIAKVIKNNDAEVPVVLDPVLAASTTRATNCTTQSEEIIRALQGELFPVSTLITPNLEEAAVFANHPLITRAQREAAAAAIAGDTKAAVLLKGGHGDGPTCDDVLYCGGETMVFSSPRGDYEHTRATGCTLASLCASMLAGGANIPEAAKSARTMLGWALPHGRAVGTGPGPVNPLWGVNRQAECSARQRPARLHVITDTASQQRWSATELAEAALRGGASTIQFRDKSHKDTRELVASAEQIARLCAAHDASLIVNDRVDVAKTVTGAGAHIGACDLSPIEARSLLGPKPLLGATANSVAEARDLADAPIDYLGVGPVYQTSSKVGAKKPIGCAGLAQIASLARVPVIAIGGITADRVADVAAAGAAGVAVIGAVCNSNNPTAATKDLINAVSDNWEGQTS